MTKGTPSPRFGLSLLGGFELVGPDGVVDLPSKKIAGLLAYLACTMPKAQPRERLAALLWGSNFEAQAKQSLRQALYRLRSVLGQDALESDGDVVPLNAAAVQCDVSQFEALVCEGSRDALSAAVDLYRGHLMDDVAISEKDWNEWLSGEREKLLELALGALLRLGEQELAAGRAEHALKAGQRAITLNNLREDAHRLIVQSLAAAGRKAEALKHYQDLVALLKRELNTEPDAATKSLVAEVRSTQPPDGGATGKEAAAPTMSDRRRPEVQPAGDIGEDPEQTVTANSTEARSDAPSPAVAARSAGPERRQLTIMVCTMVGSIPLAVALDPEDMSDRIAAFHRLVTEVAARFDGFVAQYLGDGVHIYFGYPAANEHDAEQAVRAGLAIVDAVRAHNASSGEPFQARAGIATGLVVVGEQAVTGNTRQRVAIGESPNLAAQLQAVAAPGEVVIAASTRRLVGRMFDCRALAAGELEGLPSSLEAWHVRAEKIGVSRFEARRTGALSPLVGRQEEMELLLRRWNQAKLGQGRVVLLSGEPGIGKSRIAETLLHSLGAEPHTRLRYSCSPHHTHSALHPFIAQLAEEASFESGSSAAAKLDKLEALLKPTSRNAVRDVPLIAELLGVPAEARYPQLAVSAQQKREMTLTALLDRLDGVAARSPVLIVFEDAHWIDPTSLDLLDRIVARAANLPLLLIVTVRPEAQPAWVGQPHITMLHLNRLERRDSTAIIGGITKSKELPAAVIEQVLAHTDGVPLFIEELTNTLLESELLREESDRYVLERPLPPRAIPTTLQASLVARLDRLSSVKEVAQIGAAIGREFSHELIAWVWASAPTDLDAALDRLMAAGLISRRGTPPNATYSFKHALIQDAAYDTMLKSRRRHLHASIAKVLVERMPAMCESLPEVVAHHFAEAGLGREAIDYWLKAGRLASARSANGEAVKSFERALAILASFPESQSALEQAFDIRLELRPALNHLGEVQRARQILREAEALADRLNDDRRRVQVCAFVTNSHSYLGELNEAHASGTRALRIARALQDLDLRILATTYLVQAHYFRGEYERAVALATENLAALPIDRVYEYFGTGTLVSVFDRWHLVTCLSHLGRFAEATEVVAEAIRFAEPIKLPYTLGQAYFAAGTLCFLKGEWATAGSHVQHALQLVRSGNVVVLLPQMVACSAWIQAELGEASEALNQISQGEQLAERLAASGFILHLGWTYHALARASFLLGRLEQARHLGERALKYSPSHPGFAAYAQHLLGDLATHSDRVDAKSGEAHYQQALALAEPLGMRPLVAHCMLGLGKLYRRTSKPGKARENFATALSMYRQMDMQYWLRKAQAGVDLG
jgi:class 3 adenylate cyclase/DNA-binding SARP family transcriptional activator